jgi:hypothetical protein
MQVFLQDGKINFRLGGRKGKSKTLTISNLMKEYFNGVKCHHCDNMVTKKYSKVCNKCRRDIARKTERKWQLNNPDKINKYHKKKVENLPKHYVANLLGLKSNEITDELYIHHRKLMMIKREIAETHNIPIQSFSHI